MKPQTFKRSKSTWDNEEKALQDVLQKQFVTVDELQAEHTDKQFVWNRPPEEKDYEAQFLSPKLSFSKEEHTETEAIAIAIERFDTTEGNLTREDTDTHFVIRKTRE